MSTITFDFRHRYQKGERRPSEQIAYQWDLGHVAEIFVPVNATYEINYCFYDYEEADAYEVDSIETASDGGYKITAHVPNKYFERSGELKVYVIGTSDDQILTTYEGYITIRDRIQPDDYVDEDPDNTARGVITEASEAAEAWAKGTRGGTVIPETDPAYHNNAKYYAETVAEGKAEDAEAFAVGTRKGVPVTNGDPAFHHNSKYYAENTAAGINFTDDNFDGNIVIVPISS